MTNVSIHGPTGVLQVDGQKVFPIGLSDPPPHDAQAPSGQHAFQELANGGATMIRTGTPDWAPARINHQIATETAIQDAAAAHGLYCWMRLGPVPTCRARPPTCSCCRRSSAAFKNHPALCAYKGVDEPRNPFRGANWIRPAGLVRGATRIKALDPAHPLVIIQAPRGPVSQLVAYRPAFDITGVDIFPIAYPPGLHCDNGNADISVVGDMTDKMMEASGGKPVWMTLQIAWSGTAPSKERPRHRAALPVAPPGALHGLPGDRARRPRPRLLRRASDRGLHARRRQGGLELDVLAAGAAARSSTSSRRATCSRRCWSRTRRSRSSSSRTLRA